MKIFNLIESIGFIASIVLLFFNWKMAIVVFLISSIIHVIPKGPNVLLKVICGYSMIIGVVYLFIDLKIGLIFIFLSLLVVKFRNWSMKKNYEFYKKGRG